MSGRRQFVRSLHIAVLLACATCLCAFETVPYAKYTFRKEVRSRDLYDSQTVRTGEIAKFIINGFDGRLCGYGIGAKTEWYINGALDDTDESNSGNNFWDPAWAYEFTTNARVKAIIQVYDADDAEWRYYKTFEWEIICEE